MKTKSPIPRCFLVLSMALVLALQAGGAGSKKPKSNPNVLVWPLPPDEPRIRFVQEIHGTAEIEGVRKEGLLDRVAGIKRVKIQPQFVKPHGVATDSKHRIYVADSLQHVVFVLDREKHQVSYIGLDGPTRLRMPLGITVDGKDRIWIADGPAQHVYAYDPAFNVRAALGKKGEMQNPSGVAVDTGRNRLYVADSKQHRVLVYDTETGLLITKFGSPGKGTGEFHFPTNVALDRDGRIYVADTLNSRVQIFDSSYHLLGTLGRPGIEWGDFRKPKGVALDRFGNIYVVDSDFSNFQIFDQKKQLLLFVGSLGEGPGEFLLPAGIHIDGEDLIYVTDQSNRRIQIFKLLKGDTAETSAATTPASR